MTEWLIRSELVPRRLFVTDIWNKDFNTEGLSEQDQDQVAESTAETVGG